MTKIWGWNEQLVSNRHAFCGLPLGCWRFHLRLGLIKQVLNYAWRRCGWLRSSSFWCRQCIQWRIEFQHILLEHKFVHNWFFLEQPFYNLPFTKHIYIYTIYKTFIKTIQHLESLKIPGMPGSSLAWVVRHWPNRLRRMGFQCCTVCFFLEILQTTWTWQFSPILSFRLFGISSFFHQE